ncbi:MAG TPA: hypothetical protein VJV78_30450 [Polyangiales bacterium]|nr:hypothetical protein [Polyangiales bacterium]
MVETPTGYTQTSGPATNTAYMAKVAMEHNIAHITVYERSECAVIRMKVVDRVEEMLNEDGEVVQRESKGTIKIAEGQTGTKPCEERFARVPLMLSYNGNTYPLGDTSPTGDLSVDLASVLKPGTRGVDLSSDRPGVLLVAGRPVGEVPLGGVAQQQKQLDAVLAELNPILGKPANKLTDAEVTRAYTLYEQMRELGPDDARVVAAQRRFVEVIGGFKDLAKTESLKRNLAALGEAKDLLKALASVVPSYVATSINDNSPSADALAWAQAAAMMQFRNNPALCKGAWDWGRVADAQGQAALAFQYLRYAYDDSYGKWMGSACRR